MPTPPSRTPTRQRREVLTATPRHSASCCQRGNYVLAQLPRLCCPVGCSLPSRSNCLLQSPLCYCMLISRFCLLGGVSSTCCCSVVNTAPATVCTLIYVSSICARGLQSILEIIDVNFKSVYHPNLRQRTVIFYFRYLFIFLK